MIKCEIAAVATTILFVLSAGVVSAENDSNQAPVKISGSAYYMFGQILHGYEVSRETNPVRHKWINTVSTTIAMSAAPTQWLSFKAGLELYTWLPISAGLTNKGEQRVVYKTFIPQAEAVLHWNCSDMFAFGAELGMFPYKYNSEARNLGEYLLRCDPYPLFIETKTDRPYATLLGLRLRTSFFNNTLHNDVIVNSKFERPPFYNGALSEVVSYNLANILDLGAGISFDHLFSVNEGDSALYGYFTDMNRIPGQEGTGGDTTFRKSNYYTFKGAKLMFRATFDPKPLFHNSSLLGAEDGKLYAELGVLGLKDYTYDVSDTLTRPTLLHRMPLMIGINIPAFKILDLLNFELEYCAYPYENSYYNAMEQKPRPGIASDSIWRNIYKTEDNLKWSVYLRKDISRLSVIVIWANDHAIYETVNWENRPCFEQYLRTRKSMHWFCKLNFKF
jgi:hypothetical protein